MTTLTKENEEKYLALLQAGVFDLDSGRVEINVNNGKVQNVHIHKMTYKRETKTNVIPL